MLMKKRTIGFITVARSDYNTIKPVYERAAHFPGLEPQLYVTGIHLSPEFGSTIQDIRKDGIPIAETVDMVLSSDSPSAIAKTMGLGTICFAQLFEKQRPDILVIAGDRLEMHCVASAAVPFKIPITHLRGGEVTHGAIDDNFRHSLTKMSHLHFVAHESFAKRIRQLGEEPWRVFVSGDPGLDLIERMTFPNKNELERTYSIDLSKPTLLITFHPVTLEYEQTALYTDNLLKALAIFKDRVHFVFTYPNSDTYGRVIIQKINAFCNSVPMAFFIKNFGQSGYYGMMRCAAAMVGNSSSGIWESGSFQIPVVNIGKRQGGRLRPANVVDVNESTTDITQGIEKALSDSFRQSLTSVQNPYSLPGACDFIVKKLSEVPLDGHLIIKKFHDLA